MRAPLLWLSLAFFAGVAVATGFSSATVELTLLVVVATGAGLLAAGRERRMALPVVLAALLFGLGLLRAADGPADAGAAAMFVGRPLVLEGLVESDPVVRRSDQEVRLSLEAVSLGAERAAAQGDVLLRAGPGLPLRYGDRLRATASLRATGASGGSDFDDYLAERGIGARGFATEVTILARHQGNALRAALSAARGDLDTALGQALDEPLAGLAQGIVTGRRGALAPDLREDLNATGLSHLVVISGSNVTLLAVLVVAGTAWLLGRRRAIWLAIGVIGLYTAFVGAEAPVVRAAIMGSLFLLAGAAGRRGAAEPAIALAAALMVAVQPRVIDDLSFQLSFAATLALASIAEPARLRAFAWVGLDRTDPTLGRRLQGALLETGLVTGAAVAATLPLIALHFGRISLLALPANLFVAPTFPFIFLGSLGTAVVGAIDAGVGEAAAWLLAWLPLSWFVEVAERLSDLGVASAQVDGFGLGHALVLYAGLLALALWLRRSRRSGGAPGAGRARLPAFDFPLAMTALGAVVAMNLVVWWAVASDHEAVLEAHVLDVGQGDAIVAVSPSGGTLLVDGGPDGQRLMRELSRALPAGQRRLDVVVATHPQADHLSGLFAVLDRYRVGRLVVSPLNDASALGRQLRTAAAAQGIAVKTASAGMLLELGGGVEVDVLAPVAGAPLPAGDLNAAGVVLRLRHGAVALLLAADVGAAQELALARGPWELASAGLKVAHHGSATSTTDLLLRRTRPAVAVISVGEGNGFGHPRPGVLARLDGTVVLRTDEDGAVRLRSDGRTLRYSAAR